LDMFNPLKETSFTSQVTKQLIDYDLLRNSRIHPISLLVAEKTYASGQGKRSTWIPSPKITDALNSAFYRSFKTVEPTGKRIMLALDVSGSMAQYNIADLPMTPREASAALALVTAASEPNHMIVGFSDGISRPTGREGGYIGNYWGHGSRDSIIAPLSISPMQRLDDVTNYIQSLNFGATDLALPMIHAIREKLAVDSFVIYTDNETWFCQVLHYKDL